MEKASRRFRTVCNPQGPVISTVSRRILESDGLYFKDIDGSGQLKPFDDWRLSPQERAEAYVKELTTEEKIGQLFTSDWHMAEDAQDKEKLDPTGLLDEGTFVKKNIFGELHLPGTHELLKEWWARHLIFRANPSVEAMTDFFNELHAVAEECPHFIPVQCLSNSRNENGEVVFGMNDSVGLFATYPGTMGIAAATLGDIDKAGDSVEAFRQRAEKATLGDENEGRPESAVIDGFADTIRREWNAVGLKKGYMYMADVVTDPRWQRSYGTFGEHPGLVTALFDRLIPRIQGSENGPTADGVSVTVKHFPGGGARENGFDPHYKAGQWNVYETEGSLLSYHLPSFFPAVRRKAASIMPYCSKPSGDKSAPQRGPDGNLLPLTPQGFAYNRSFIQGLLRGEMGYEGYVNSDTGIVHNMSWGVEMLDIPERIAYAVNNGVDLIGGMFDIEAGKEALRRTREGYYDSHPLPEGFTREELELTEESIDRAVTRTLTELFALGMFEDPFRDPQTAESVVHGTKKDWDAAALAHRKSVVLLKNDGTLPLTGKALEGKKIYARFFMKDPKAAESATPHLRSQLRNLDLTEDPNEADLALLFVTPSSGAYFSATQGYLELDLCDGKTVHDVDEAGRPVEAPHEETTVSGMEELRAIAQAVHARGGKVLSNLNITLAWMPGNLESVSDVLTCGFDTEPEAVLDVMFGRFLPQGKLPVTLPRGDAVLAVSADGVCVSPNDVPGYDKDLYLPQELKDQNGKGYAYRDSAGNYYEFGFGLGSSYGV